MAEKVRYQALGPLLSGEGSRAFLGLATEDGLSPKPVVMVWVPPDVAEDEEKVASMQKETLRAAILEHPNIIKVHGLASLDEGIARVVEFADGESLRRVLEVCQKLPAPFAALAVADAATGLHYAHLAGNDDGSPLVHGDLRPETLMVCFSGFTKVSGYGALTVAPRETGGKRVVHRRLYAAPEQIIGGRNAISVQTDVYLLGLALYECLTGLMPFQGEVNFDQAVVNKSLSFSGFKEIPSALVPVLQRATSKRAADRYPTPLAFRNALLEAGGPLPSHEEFSQFLEGYFPSTDAARAARRRVLDAGLAEFARKTGEFRAVAPAKPAPPPVPVPVPVAAQPVSRAAPAPAASAPVGAAATPLQRAPAPKPAVRPAPSRPLESEPPSFEAAPERPRAPLLMALVVGTAALTLVFVGVFISAKPGRPPVAATPPVPRSQPVLAHSAPSDEAPPMPGAAVPSQGLAASTFPGRKAPEAPPASEPAELPRRELPPAPAAPPAGPATLEVTVTPAVEVLVDGKSEGRSPLSLPLPAGRHALVLRDKAQGINLSRSVLMPAHGKQVTRVTVGKGFLTVTLPSGSTLYLDGKPVGRGTVTDYPVFEGTHRLVVKLGQAAWRQEFDLQPDEHVKYDVEATSEAAAVP